MRPPARLPLAVMAVALLGASCAADPEPVTVPPPAALNTPAATQPPAGASEDASPGPADPEAAADAPPPTDPTAPPERAEPGLAVESIDFRNGFTYTTDVGPPVTVIDGQGRHGELGDEDFVSLVVADVAVGDLDGDGDGEAAVVTVSNTGGSGQFSRVDLFDVVDGVLDDVGVVFGGDRAHGGIYDIDIRDGVLIVEQFGTTNGACCPETLTQARWGLGGDAALPLEWYPARTFLAVGTGVEDELKFLPGTTSAVLAYYDFAEPVGVPFEAAKGQVVQVRHVEGVEPHQIRIVAASPGASFVSEGQVTVLPDDGFYELVVDFAPGRDERSTLIVSIESAAALASPTWTTAYEHIVLGDDPPIEAIVSWPELVAADEGNLDSLNDAIAAFARAPVDPWLASIEIPDGPVDPDRPFGEGDYEAGYRVTLVAPDLVSVHFDYYEYVCCRPYPNLGQRSLIVDLEQGRLLEVSEVLDLSRLDELQRLWAEALLRDDPELGDLVTEPGTPIRFTAFSLVPEGIELGTDRGEFGAVVPPLSALITWDALGDLVDPDIRARAVLGRVPAPPLPHAQD